MDPQAHEERLHHTEGRAPTVADLGPHSPGSTSSSMIPFGMGEDSSLEDQVQQDQALEQMEIEEEEEDLPMEEAISNPPMIMKTAPAKYQPASPKYVRDEEEDVPPHTIPTLPVSIKAICPVPVILSKDKRKAAILVETPPFSHSPSTKANQGRRAPLK